MRLTLLFLLLASTANSQTATFNFEGDSISETNQNRWDSFFTGMMQSKLPGSDYHIWALSGDTASNMVSEYVSQAHTKAPGTNIGFFMLLAGLNDLRGGDTAVHVQSNLAALWGFARADGFKVAAFTMTPDYNQPGNSPFWQQWTNLNAWIEMQTNAYDYLVPMAETLTQSDLIDGLHPTASGAIKLATLVSNTLFNLPSIMVGPELHGPVGNFYSLQTSTNLQSWTDVQTNLVPASGVISFGETVVLPQQFFRARFVK